MIVFIQPALPAYRKDFFERVSQYFVNGVIVAFSPQDMGALTNHSLNKGWQHEIGQTRKLFGLIEWQVGSLSVPIHKNDIVVLGAAPRALTTYLNLMRAKLNGARVIWWGQFWGANSSRMGLWIRMWFARTADACLFYTDREVQRLVHEKWRITTPVSALNNGIDVTTVRVLRRKYSAKERERSILFLGRLTPKSNLKLLIESLSSSALRDVSLHIIGDGQEECALRTYAHDSGVAKRVYWHGGSTSEQFIASIANKCAAFVYPGQVGLSLIHAMAYGLPCIVHRNFLQQMPEIAAFEDERTGFTFEAASSESLANAVEKVFKDSGKAEDMSCRCVQRTETDFNTQSMTNRFIELVHRLESDRR